MSNETTKPQLLFEAGSGHPLVVFNVGSHGDEDKPVRAAEEFATGFDETSLLKGTVRIIVSNKPALLAGIRYIDDDLNRAFPGDPSSKILEARLAPQILPLVTDADYVVDLHTAPSDPPFTIVGAKNKTRLELAEISPVRDIVLFEASTPCAMVDFTNCGIGIELGSHDDPKAVNLGLAVMHCYLEGLGLTEALNTNRKLPHNYYEIFAELTRADIPKPVIKELKNFEPIKPERLRLNTDEKAVYPVLCGDKDYTDMFCLLAKRVTRESIEA